MPRGAAGRAGGRGAGSAVRCSSTAAVQLTSFPPAVCEIKGAALAGWSIPGTPSYTSHSSPHFSQLWHRNCTVVLVRCTAPTCPASQCKCYTTLMLVALPTALAAQVSISVLHVHCTAACMPDCTAPFARLDASILEYFSVWPTMRSRCLSITAFFLASTATATCASDMRDVCQTCVSDMHVRHMLKYRTAAQEVILACACQACRTCVVHSCARTPSRTTPHHSLPSSIRSCKPGRSVSDLAGLAPHATAPPAFRLQHRHNVMSSNCKVCTDTRTDTRTHTSRTFVATTRRALPQNSATCCPTHLARLRTASAASCSRFTCVCVWGGGRHHKGKSAKSSTKQLSGARQLEISVTSPAKRSPGC